MANGHATQPEQPDSLRVESAAEVMDDLLRTGIQLALGWRWPKIWARIVFNETRSHNGQCCLSLSGTRESNVASHCSRDRLAGRIRDDLVLRLLSWTEKPRPKSRT